ncbi:MAG: Hsp33 family molecular chaperone HslO, partial [Spirochaetaceae bacterium]|nr:Hsp33 family molecular chaperone HslO [Spirochaetaceae bacterium]
MIQAPITDETLVTQLNAIEKDGMSIFMMGEIPLKGRSNGTAKGYTLRGALFNGTRFINQMRANHGLGVLETMVLGQASLCAALMIPTMKGRQRLSFRYDTMGPAAG